ncbi:MAG: hypothetical protein WCA12_06800 [Burkholderiales bacterium]
MNGIRSMLGFLRRRGDLPPLCDVLEKTPPERLDETVARLNQPSQAAELRKAYIDLLRVTPVEHHTLLKLIYMKHLAR